MKKKKKIYIQETTDDRSQSKIVMKHKGEGRESYKQFTISNHGSTWCKPGEKRLKITISDWDSSVTITTPDGQEFKTGLLELCDIIDIGNHFKDLELNIKTDTEVL